MFLQRSRPEPQLGTIECAPGLLEIQVFCGWIGVNTVIVVWKWKLRIHAHIDTPGEIALVVPRTSEVASGAVTSEGLRAPSLAQGTCGGSRYTYLQHSSAL